MGSPREEVLNPTVRDVAIVGAGPAGLITARNLSSAGHDVVVLEEHASIGLPVHCTGLLGSDAFDELDLPRHAILATAQAARFIGADGKSVLVDAERVRASIVDRGIFDQMLADRARAAGTDIRTSARVRSIRVTTDRVVIAGDSGDATVQARACVLACGASYRFNRELGLGVPRTFVQSAQFEAPFAGPDQIEVHFGRETAPGGFAWVVPFARGGRPFNRVGMLCENRVAARFATFTKDVRERHAAGEEKWPEARLKILPLAPVPKTFASRVVAVGDAAGLVKPTTGGGIYYGLVSGALAADVLDGALQDDQLHESRLMKYESAWRARLGAEIRTGLAFRSIMGRLNDRAIDSLVELARIDGIVPLLKQTADFNWHRRSALTLLRHAPFRRIILASLWG
jgi:digeranylgeranylglycerophospholipid reductase